MHIEIPYGAEGDHSGGQIRVMTQNLYDGTDRTGLLEATSIESFLAADDQACRIGLIGPVPVESHGHECFGITRK